MGGRFISFEGGEGSGKSTQLRRLAARLSAQDVTVITTREPGGTPGAEDIRQLLVEGEPGRWDGRVEALLVNAARTDHVARLIRPALAEGKWVLCDRYVHSTLAYQGYGHGLGRELIDTLNELVVADTRPDLTLILDLPEAEGLKRAAARRGGEARYERMDLDFHRNVRQGFLEIARLEPARCVVIESAGDIETTQAALRDAVRERLEVAL